MNKSEQVNELFEALSKAQAEINDPVKNASNPFFKSGYANLQAILASVREPLSKNGLCVVQTVTTQNDCPMLETVLGHKSGQFVSSSLPLEDLKTADFKTGKGAAGPQVMGSALTYARRYALAAIVGVTQADDDGESFREPPTERKTDKPVFKSSEMPGLKVVQESEPTKPRAETTTTTRPTNNATKAPICPDCNIPMRPPSDEQLRAGFKGGALGYKCNNFLGNKRYCQQIA